MLKMYRPISLIRLKNSANRSSKLLLKAVMN